MCKARENGLCLLHNSVTNVTTELSEDQKMICKEQRRHAKQMEQRSKEINAPSNAMTQTRRLQQQNRNSLHHSQFVVFDGQALEQSYQQRMPMRQVSVVNYPQKQQTRPAIAIMDDCDNNDEGDGGEDLYAYNDEDDAEERAELAQMELDELEDDSFVVSDDVDMDEEEEEHEYEEENQEESVSS
jgi:hypothetical protein